jgi:cobalt-zinc-cadmium efflux system membrane fusion protein
MQRLSWLICLASLTGAPILTSCTNNHAAADQPGKAEAFCIPDSLFTKIRLDTVKSALLRDELQLTGKVTYNEDKVVKVYPLVGGVVEELKVELGDYVKKGQVLAVIRSGEIAEFDQQFVAAESNLNIARKNLDVAEDMFKSGLNSEKDVVTARREAEKAEGELHRVKEVLKIYGVGKQSIYTIKSPISGFVVEKNVTEEMQFRTENTSQLFTISDLDHVWVLANVYESDIAKVKVGYEVDIKTISYPDKVFKGKIDKIFSMIDPESKVLKVRISLENKDYILKPEMFANVVVKYTESQSMSTVPAEAVIFDKNKYFLMVFDDQCHLQTREVNVYKTVSPVTYIQSGLKEGEKVVSRYQLLIYDALND